MVKSKTQVSAFEEMQRLEAPALEADRAVQTAEATRRQRLRRYDAAQLELSAYFAGVGFGNAPDPTREAELREKVAELRARLGERTIPIPAPNGRGGTRTELFDPEAEGLIAGAQQRAMEAHDAAIEFVIEHRDELQAELVERSLQEGDNRMQAARDFLTADQRCRALRTRWVQLGERWGFAPAEVPLAAFDGIAMQDIETTLAQVEGGAKDPRGVIPMPVRLGPGGDPEEIEYAGSLKGWAQVPRVISSAGGLGY